LLFLWAKVGSGILSSLRLGSLVNTWQLRVEPKKFRFRCSFICQDTSTRRQQSDLFGLRVKLPPTQR